MTFKPIDEYRFKYPGLPLEIVNFFEFHAKSLKKIPS